MEAWCFHGTKNKNMKKTVKELESIDIEKLLDDNDLEVVIEEQEPHGARKIRHRMKIKDIFIRSPRSVNSYDCPSIACYDPDDDKIILIDLADLLDWQIITLPNGKEIGPFKVTCQYEDTRE